MKITNIRFAKLIVPLVTPFKTTLRSVTNIDDLVVIIDTDSGEIGYGSAPATPAITGDTHDSILLAIETAIKPLLIGRSIAEISDNTNIVQSALIKNTSAKAAVEIALYDLWGKLYQAPLYKLLGGGCSQLKTDITISIDTIDKMISDCQKALAQGFDRLKIKVGKDIQQDIERIKSIYNVVQGKALLRLDVNQGWTAKQTIFAMQKLDEIGVELELIEQPVNADDLVGMGHITAHATTPIMADESAFGPKDVIELITSGAADIINIKLMKAGGLSNAIKIADICQIYQVDCMMGCMLESSIGVAAAVHVAAAKANVITKIDLDGPILGQYDPVQGGVDFNLANIRLGDGPGLGIERIDGLIEL